MVIIKKLLKMTYYQAVAMVMFLVNGGLWLYALIQGNAVWHYQLISPIYFCTFLILGQINRSSKDSKTIEFPSVLRKNSYADIKRS